MDPTPSQGAGVDPEDVASAVDTSQSTELAESVEFLYTGANPVQTGVAAGTIVERRVAVLKGKVLTRSGQPLGGVAVTVRDHPELGRTLTQVDGEFDMAVNGGGMLTLDFAKDGYISSQRQVDAPWQDFAAVDDVALVRYDPKVTDIDAEATDHQAAQATPVSDSDGARQATVLFPPGNSAVMELPDGTTRPLGDLKVRATEYTVGARGPEAMPGELPPTSAYTYAVELSVDEAVAAGATDVRFSKPVVNYTENFLEFPVGTPVPTGWYDREKAQWVPSKDGTVVKVVGEADGLARVDTDGDGAADDGLEITDGERRRLADLYDSGESLWRVEMKHFTPWDHNWPYGPPDDAVGPWGGGPTGGPNAPASSQPKPEKECYGDGSIIACQTQRLGEELPLTGTTAKLGYWSDRVPGRVDERILQIPITGSSPPASLRGAILLVSVAGKTTRVDFGPAPNQSYPFKWDGLDAYGRRLQGARPVEVRLGYMYQPVYQSPARTGTGLSAFDASFARFGSSVQFERAFPGRNAITIWSRWEDNIEGSIGSWDARASGIGGWALDVHHAYDPQRRVVHLGDGSTLDIEPTITTAAGRASEPNCTIDGDGGPASAARLNFVQDIVQAPDGSVFFSETCSDNLGRIRKIAVDGTLSTYAGKGFSFASQGDGGPATEATVYPGGLAIGPDGDLYFTDIHNQAVRRIDAQTQIITSIAGGKHFSGFPVGDGGPATEAQLNNPSEVAVGADGSVFIADTGWDRVRRVTPDGIIETYAGGGDPDPYGNQGDGGRATDARVSRPTGLAIGEDGSLFVAHDMASYNSTGDRIRRIAPDGIITTVAGGVATKPAGLGDGYPATEEWIEVGRIAFAPDGSLLVTEHFPSRVRRIDPKGIISTLAGGGTASPGDGDFGPATRARVVEPTGVAAGTDGSVHITQLRGRVRKVARPFPISAQGELSIPSRDGDEIHQFTAGGRHLRTVDGLTGDVLRSFGYDDAGRLVSMTDLDGLVTRIERDGDRPSAIVAPGGQRTLLSVDADGWLSRVSNPASEEVTMSYGTGGLLTSLTDARGGLHRFEHDARGRLISDEDPDGGKQTLSHTEYDDGYKVSITTKLGRTRSYEVRRRPEGGLRLATTDAAGATTTVLASPDHSQTATYPDGTTAVTTAGLDPRWGWSAPMLASLVERTPGGRTRTTTRMRQVTLDGGDRLKLLAQTDSVTTNAQTTTRAYDQASRTITQTSPAGRVSTTKLDSRGRAAEIGLPGVAPSVIEHDARGRVTKMEQGAKRWTFAHDAGDRLTSRTNALGQQTTFGHDGADRVDEVTNAEGGTLGIAYDGSGNKQRLTMPAGQAHDQAHTSRGKLSLYRPPGATAGLVRTFDDDGALKRETLPGDVVIDHARDAGGRPTGTTFPQGSTSLAYHGTSRRLASLERAPASAGDVQRVDLLYDGDLPTKATASAGGAVQAVFDWTWSDDQRVASTKTTVGTTQILSNVTRDADGLVTAFGPFTWARSGPGGAVGAISDGTSTSTYAYDEGALPTDRSMSVGGTSRYAANITRDPAGRISRKQETVSGTSATYDYTYDRAGRLVRVDEDGSQVEAYAYDANGNRTSRRSVGDAGAQIATYDAQDRLSARGGVAHTWTAAGFLSARGSDSFGYSARGELESATVGATTVTYRYDALGRRVARVQAGAVTRYFYGNPTDPFEVTAVRSPAGEVTRYFYDEAGLLYAMQRGATRYYIATDQVGTPRLVLSTTGVVRKALSFDAFGRTLTDSDASFELPFGFAGGLADPVTGLVRFGLRDYDPEAGRWTARDPALFGGGQANLYVYAGNDPVAQRDPTGLFCIGGSVYSGFGGGATFCHTDEGTSVCVEAGFGAGVDADIDFKGDPADTGTAIVAEVKAEFGPLGGKLGAELDNSGCLSGGPEFELGPVKLTPDDINVKPDIPIELDGPDALLKSGGGSVQGKIAAKICQKF